MTEISINQIQPWITRLSRNIQTLDSFDHLLQSILEPPFVSSAAAVLAMIRRESSHQRQTIEIVASQSCATIAALATGTTVPAHGLQNSLTAFRNSGREILIESLSDLQTLDPELRGLLQLMPHGAEAAAFLPLIESSNLLGIIGIFWPNEQTFTPEHHLWFQLLLSISAPITYHLQMRLQNEQYRLDLLFDISTALHKAQTSAEVLKALEPVARLLDAQGMNLNELLYDDENEIQELRIMEEWTRDGDTLLPKGTRYPMRLKEVWMDQKGVTFIEDLGQDSRVSQMMYSVTQRVGVRALVAIPILSNGLWYNLVYIGWSKPRSFTRAEQNLFDVLQELLTPVLNRLRLFSDLLERQRLLDEAQRNLSQRLVELLDEERRHIARELHDEVGQHITAAMFYLKSTLAAPSIQKKTFVHSLNTVMNDLSDLANRVGHMSLALLPPMLDDFGLIPTLEWHIKGFQEHTGIQIDFLHNGFEERFSPAIETTFFRITQEALTNVARHANTSKAEINLHFQRKDGITLQVVDTGIGFDVEKVLALPHSAGLLSMQQRAKLISADLQILSRPETGTAVLLFLPVQQVVYRKPHSLA